LVARAVLLPLQALELGSKAPSRRLERRDLFQRLVGIETAMAQRRADLVDVVADVSGIEHKGRHRDNQMTKCPDDCIFRTWRPPFARPFFQPPASARAFS